MEKRKNRETKKPNDFESLFQVRFLRSKPRHAARETKYRHRWDGVRATFFAFFVIKRPRDPAIYSRFGSMDNHLRPNFSAAEPVVLLPPNGSTTKSPGFVRNL